MKNLTSTNWIWATIMLGVIILLGAIPMASATLSFSNYYDLKEIEGSKYGSIDVWNGNWVLPDEKLKTFTLESNTEQCLIDCSASGQTELLKEGNLLWRNIICWNLFLEDRREEISNCKSRLAD